MKLLVYENTGHARLIILSIHSQMRSSYLLQYKERHCIIQNCRYLIFVRIFQNKLSLLERHFKSEICSKLSAKSSVRRLGTGVFIVGCGQISYSVQLFLLWMFSTVIILINAGGLNSTFGL